MFAKLLFFFIAIPFVELALLIEIGSRIGTPETLALIILTGIIGAYLVKLEGLRTLGQIQSNMQQGMFPAEELFDGICILIAGALLITPGILTDIAGFCLVIPSTRTPIKILLKKWIRNRMDTGEIHFTSWHRH